MNSKVKILLLVSLLFSQSFVCLAEWQKPPIDISDNTENASSPWVAVDEAGNAIAVWLWDRAYPLSDVVQVSRYDVATDTWSSPVNLSDDSRSAYSPRIAMDEAGNGIALWYWNNSSSKNIVQARRYDVATDTWIPDLSADPTILSDDSRSAYTPRIAIGSDGNGIAVWEWDSPFPDKDVIQARRYDVMTASWMPTATLSNNTRDAESPEVAMDRDGNAVVVWEWDSPSPDKDVIQTRRYDVTTASWLPDLSADPTTLSDNTLDFESPEVAIDGSGNAIAIWQSTYSPYVLQANRYDAVTNSWPTLATEIFRGTQRIYSSQVVMDTVGNAIVLWRINVDGLMVKRYDAMTGLWSEAALIFNEDKRFEVNDCQIAMNPAGNAVVVWIMLDISTGTHMVQARRYDAKTASWLAIKNITDPGVMYDSRAGIDSLDNAIAVWRNDGSSNIIQASRSEFTRFTLSATTKCYRYPSQIDYIHVLEWNAMPDIASYKIYQYCEGHDTVNLPFKEAVFLGEVKAGTTTFDIHGRCPGKKVTYYVITVNQDGTYGDYATITI